MVRLTLPSSLAQLLEGNGAVPSSKSVTLRSTSWRELTDELHARFPALAKRVLTGDGAIHPGFLLVVDDEVRRRADEVIELGSNTELYILPAVAGG